MSFAKEKDDEEHTIALCEEKYSTTKAEKNISANPTTSQLHRPQTTNKDDTDDRSKWLSETSGRPGS